MNLHLKDVSFVLNKNNTNLSRYKKDVENYDPNHPIRFRENREDLKA